MRKWDPGRGRRTSPDREPEAPRGGEEAVPSAAWTGCPRQEARKTSRTTDMGSQGPGGRNPPVVDTIVSRVRQVIHRHSTPLQDRHPDRDLMIERIGIDSEDHNAL
jgi:hypothetical protein